MRRLPQESIFWGDGRRMLQPVNAPVGTHPVKIRRSTARFLGKAFDARGESYHSAAGSTVWVVVTYCLERDIPYEVVAHCLGSAVAGYVVRIVQTDSEEKQQ